MSDKETAPWMRRLEIAIRTTKFHREEISFDCILPSEVADQIMELIAVECTAPAPQPTKEEAEIAVDKMFNTWLSRHCFFYANKTLRASGWREIAISLYRRAATPQVTPTTKEFLAQVWQDTITSEQAPQELELEQEADGRWLAAYTRFPGVAAYGHSKEEAIWNAAKVLIESEALPYEKAWPIIRRALGLPEDHPDGSDILPRIEELKAAPEQASPTPEQCPTCGSRLQRLTAVGQCERKEFWHECTDAPPCPDSWHSSGTPKSRNTGISLDGGKTIHSKFKND